MAHIVATENIVDKVFDLAAALANQSNHHHIGLGIARHHAQQDTLTDATAGKQSEPLTLTHGQQRVDRTNADIERFPDGTARQRVQGSTVQGAVIVGAQGATVIQRLAGGIDHAAQQGLAHRHAGSLADRPNSGVGHDTAQLAGRHQQNTITGETHNLGFQPVTVNGFHFAVGADRRLAALGFEQGAYNATQLTFGGHRRFGGTSGDLLTTLLEPRDQMPARIKFRVLGHPPTPARRPTGGPVAFPGDDPPETGHF